MYIRSPYPPLPPFPPINSHNVFFRGPEQLAFPNHALYIDPVTGQEQTRYAFIDRMYDAATALGASRDRGGLGLGQGNIVAILSDNCIEYCILVHALLIITAPFVPFSSYATGFELKQYLEKSKPTHIFVHASLWSRLLPVVREESFPLENVFILDGEVPKNVEAGNVRSLASLIQMVRSRSIPREPIREAGKDTLAYLAFSSGTSGFPKVVMISHGNLAFSIGQNTTIFKENIKANPQLVPSGPSVTLGFLPLFHSYGLHVYCFRAVMRFSTIVLMPRWNLQLAVQCIPKYRVTTLPMIPSIVHSLLTSGKLASIDVSSVTSMSCGAAYLPPSLSAKLKATIPHAFFTDGHGMTEATLSLIGQPMQGVLNGSVEYVPNSLGILGPGLEALILRSDGSHALPNEDGDLYVKGENVALGYFRDPEATKGVFFPNGWLKTGDRLRVNTKGTFFFGDRAKDTLKVSGMQVAPAEIEAVIMAEETGIVEDVAVAGVNLPTARTSDDKTPRAWVVLTRKGKQMTPAEAAKSIEEWVQRSLSRYKWLRGGVEFVDEIPRNPSGKILRRILTNRYETRYGSHAKL